MQESNTLSPLIERNDPRIFARDVDATGKKKYFSGELEYLGKMYDRTPHKHWYEVLREGRGTRIFLDIESVRKTREEVLRGIRGFIKLLKALVKVFAGVDECFYMLDSSDSKKASFHVIGSSLYLRDVFSVGALVRRCWCALKGIQNGSVRMEGVNAKDIFESDGGWIIDDQIYNRNRCFRVAFSHKMGSARILCPTNPWDDVLVSNNWIDYLVQRTEPSDICCKEIDGSGPITTSRRAMDIMVLNDDGGWTCKAVSNVSECITNCPMPDCIEDCIRELEEHDPDLRKDVVRFNVKRQSWLVPSNGRNCLIAGREHKSNHVWYEVRFGEVRQFCHDGACRGFVNVNVDADLWMTKWTMNVDTENIICSARGGL